MNPKRFALLISLALLWLLLGSAGVACADDLTVCPDGPPTCDYAVIQEAVDVAAPGDTIKVATGVYTDVNAYGGLAQVVYISKTVIIRGGYGLDFVGPPDPAANPTTLDALGRGRVLYVIGGISPTIEGLRMTGGDASGLGGDPISHDDVGGGAYIINATALISRCHILGNSGSWKGGGLALLRGRLHFKENSVTGNTAGYGGGGLLLEDSTATLNNNTIVTNGTGEFGGGLYLIGTNATLNGNTISENTAAAKGGGGLFLQESDLMLGSNTIVSNTAGGWGGGVSMLMSSATFTDNTFSSNSAPLGGGLFLVASEVTLASNTIANNSAPSGLGIGGGVWLEDSVAVFNDNIVATNTAGGSVGGIVAQQSNAVFNGNLFFANAAGDACGGLTVHQDSQAILNNNTIISNTAHSRGGGVCLGDNEAATLSGNVISTNTADQGGGLCIWDDDATLVNNLITDNQAASNGSALFLTGDSSPRLLHTTLARNTGGDGSGIYVESGIVGLTNTILVSHNVGIYVVGGNTAMLEGTLWGNDADWGGAGTIVTGTRNYWGNPAFLDPLAGDYHIGETSIARDAGVTPVSATSVDGDIDGQLRPMDRDYDLGADEYPGVGLALSKPVLAVNRGEAFTYTLTITDVGLDDATSVVLTDILGSWQRPVTAVSSQGGVVVDPSWGGQVVGTLGDLVAGTSAQITVTAEVTTNVSLRQPMTSTLVARTNETSNSHPVTMYTQNCHVRLNDASTKYSTLQAAVDTANSGDLVKVAGACVGAGKQESQVQLGYLNKSLVVRGGYTTTNWLNPNPEANPTTLDGLGMGRVLYVVGPEVSLTLKGLRITGGDVIGLLDRDWKDQVGGGVYVSDAAVTISHCQVFSNTAHSGGGLWLEGGAGILQDNLISTNFAEHTAPEPGSGGQGGGLCLNSSDATLDGNVIVSNTASWKGGGLCLRFGRSTLDGNSITGNSAGYGGGGLSFDYTTATLSDNTISANHTHSFGGGFLLSGGNLLFTGNDLIFNTTEYKGGGLYAGRSGQTILIGNIISANAADDHGGGGYLNESGATLINNLIADNQVNGKGSGLYIKDSVPRFLHTTFARNGGGDGSGIYVLGSGGDYSTLLFTNTILVSHTVGVYVAAGSTATLESTLWGNETDWAGPGTIDRAHDYWGDPDFLDPAVGDYHVGPSSIALDRGVDAGVAVDIDGDPRPLGPGFDLGADEAPAAVPGIPTLLTPPDGHITTTQAMTLTWQAGAGSPPTGYNLDLDGVVVTTTDTSSTTLLSVGVHTWTVRAFNQVGYSKWATAWTVEVTETLPPPGTPILLWPPDGTITTTQSLTLAWRAGPGSAPVGYNLDLDGAVITSTATSSATLLPVGVHTWTVRAFNQVGYSKWATAWTAEIQPNQAPHVPSNPDPADGMVDVPLTPTLGWQGGDPDGDPVTYTLAFGAGNPPPVVAQVTATGYDPGPLAYATAYHWAITATDGLSTTAGPTWSFTTALTPCVPVTGVELARATPGTVYAGDTVDFQADIAPDDAAKPYTYTVSVGGQTAVQPTAGSADPLAFSHTFPATGTYAVEMAVWNCGMTEPVTDTVQVNVYEPGVCVEVEAVELSLLTPGPIYAGDAAQFSADLAPSDLTLPYTYTIHLDGTTLVYPQVGSSAPFTFSHTFPATGTYTVEVAVWNCGLGQAGAVTDTVAVEVAERGGYWAYLPVVMRGYGP